MKMYPNMKISLIRNSLMCLNGFQTFPSLCVPDTNESIFSPTQKMCSAIELQTSYRA